MTRLDKNVYSRNFARKTAPYTASIREFGRTLRSNHRLIHSLDEVGVYFDYIERGKRAHRIHVYSGFQSHLPTSLWYGIVVPFFEEGRVASTVNRWRVVA